MAKINQQPPKAPLWPWGGPRSVRERLVDPSQVDRKKKAGKKGDAKNPALASTALLDFIGPGHTADELRLPEPPMPGGHDADLGPMAERMHLSDVAGRGKGEARGQLDRNVAGLRASPERQERLKALLSREAQMLELVGRLSDDVDEIQRRRREEQKEEGY